jgi:hypothetical protein
VNTEENPEDLIQFRPGSYFLQSIIFFLCTKTPFHGCGTFFPQFPADNFAMFFMFSGPALALEVGYDMRPCSVFEICIGRVNVISGYMSYLSKETPSVTYRFDKSGSACLLSLPAVSVIPGSLLLILIAGHSYFQVFKASSNRLKHPEGQDFWHGCTLYH